MEVELVGINDTMGQVLWTLHFLADQGVFVPKTTYQDNKSTIIYCHIMVYCQEVNKKKPKSQIFFARQNQEGRSQGSILNYREHASRLLYKTPASFRKMRDVILNLPSSANAGVHRSALNK